MMDGVILENEERNEEGDEIKNSLQNTTLNFDLPPTVDQYPSEKRQPVRRSKTAEVLGYNQLESLNESKNLNDFSLDAFSSPRLKSPNSAKGPKKKARFISNRAINLHLIHERKRVNAELAIKKRTQFSNAKKSLDPIYPPILKNQESFIFEFGIAKSLLDNLIQQENTLINELELLQNQLVIEYGSELAKGEKKNTEYIEYLEEIVQKGTEMINKIKEFGVCPDDKLAKIREFSEAAQANRRQCCVRIGRIVEVLVFMAIGAVIGGGLGYVVGHLFFTYFTSIAIAAGCSSGASLALVAGKSTAIAIANLPIWIRFSIFYKETPLEKLCNKVGIAATNVVNKKGG